MPYLAANLVWMWCDSAKSRTAGNKRTNAWIMQQKQKCLSTPRAADSRASSDAVRYSSICEVRKMEFTAAENRMCTSPSRCDPRRPADTSASLAGASSSHLHQPQVNRSSNYSNSPHSLTASSLPTRNLSQAGIRSLNFQFSVL